MTSLASVSLYSYPVMLLVSPQVPLDNVDLSRMSLLYTQGEMAAVTPIYDYDFAVRSCWLQTPRSTVSNSSFTGGGISAIVPPRAPACQGYSSAAMVGNYDQHLSAHYLRSTLCAAHGRT